MNVHKYSSERIKVSCDDRFSRPNWENESSRTAQ